MRTKTIEIVVIVTFFSILSYIGLRSLIELNELSESTKNPTIIVRKEIKVMDRYFKTYGDKVMFNGKLIPVEEFNTYIDLALSKLNVPYTKKPAVTITEDKELNRDYTNKISKDRYEDYLLELIIKIYNRYPDKVLLRRAANVVYRNIDNDEFRDDTEESLRNWVRRNR